MSSDIDSEFAATGQKMPVLFVGHGSPMNALEDNEFTQGWEEMARQLPQPKAILCISAHWETRGTGVTAMPQPKTIHDFGGFPQELFDYQYPAPGSPELAQLVKQTIIKAPVVLDHQGWGLDHGTWSVLTKMYPAADIPVVQLSLDATKEPAYHYALGQELAALRDRGILIVGSGNIVHNLRLVSFSETGGYDWAIEFDETMKQLMLAGDHAAIVNYQALGKTARLAVPTNEHFLPLLYVIALQSEATTPRFFTEQLVAGSLSMRSVWID